MVSAEAPLSITPQGEVAIDQTQITSVGLLAAGQILPSFGDINVGGSAITAGELSISGNTRMQGPIMGETPLTFGGDANASAAGAYTRPHLCST